MIEVKDLRVGNWFANKSGEYRQVYRLEDEGVNGSNDPYDCNDIEYEEAFPIPLTTEILLANKFIQDYEDVFNLKYYRVDDFVLTDEFNLCGQNTPSLKYVHQLQNLYYGLYFKELSIKL